MCFEDCSCWGDLLRQTVPGRSGSNWKYLNSICSKRMYVCCCKATVAKTKYSDVDLMARDQRYLSISSCMGSNAWYRKSFPDRWHWLLGFLSVLGCTKVLQALSVAHIVNPCSVSYGVSWHCSHSWHQLHSFNTDPDSVVSTIMLLQINFKTCTLINHTQIVHKY